MNGNKIYLCIDLKSFYASVECVEWGWDPLTARLVVADPERSEKTICLAVSPALKQMGVPNRCRVFQIPKEIPYKMAPPRMQLYIDYAAEIYGVYLKYIAKEDIQVYSIDEAFLDVTDYLHLYQMTAVELGRTIMQDILDTTKIPAACGVGTNLYLAKVALDIMAKHETDRIAYLDEARYREKLWKHKPLTDFWRVGRGTVERLSNMGICTMEEIAHARESLLYKSFGIDAELLIDHAWGREPVTIADIKAYRPKNTSFSSGQVLPRDYEYEEGVLVVKEMADLLCLDLVDQGLVTSHISLVIGYSNQKCFEPAKGSTTLRSATSSNRRLLSYVEQLYRRIVRPGAYIRRITLTYTGVMAEDYQQFDLFSNPEETEKDVKAQRAAISIKQRYGKNAILKGMNLEESATTIERNGQIGGHKSGV
ncbi:DNA repair protein [Roseburia sp. AF15-21]|uniref:Y-family DNA polymerase n=1 Tax=unclassified Roseburia TaxID=2637578 RepID=UPI000E44D85A|nr:MULTISPECIES: DNA repair protein [unclassified Roseburia]RGF42759.1 DNA repair protein [Roseburia sp. AF42-8]RGI42436.1 DNA repair protein [Roseburia sp. OM04-10BH]RGI47481.1 DNA repair protein [Roseburia sp. OM03-7AC]RGI49731.1 DNA repair protein [Roseburia sp. OM03-18]RHR87901.1 DNA repair protein [Roseburia sp. AF15-21]